MFKKMFFILAVLATISPGVANASSLKRLARLVSVTRKVIAADFQKPVFSEMKRPLQHTVPELKMPVIEPHVKSSRFFILQISPVNKELAYRNEDANTLSKRPYLDDGMGEDKKSAIQSDSNNRDSVPPVLVNNPVGLVGLPAGLATVLDWVRDDKPRLNEEQSVISNDRLGHMSKGLDHRSKKRVPVSKNDSIYSNSQTSGSLNSESDDPLPFNKKRRDVSASGGASRPQGRLESLPGQEAKSWTVRYSSEKEFNKWLESLPKNEKLAVHKELADLAGNGWQIAGNKSKSLGDGLFELRVRQGENRIYYSYGADRTIIIKNSGNKTRQSNDIKDARRS